MDKSIKSCDEMLKDYSDELGLVFSRFETIEDLIKSHRELREISRQKHNLWIDEINAAKQRAYDWVINSNSVFDEDNKEWIKVDRLKNMTIMEFVNEFVELW